MPRPESKGLTAEVDQQFAAAGENGWPASAPSGRRVLIVEDDVALATFLSAELQAERFTVEVVHDGEAALATLQDERRFDLLILDLNLPKLDGISLLERVKPRSPGCGCWS